MPPVVRVDIPRHRGEVDIKTAYIEGLDHFARQSRLRVFRQRVAWPSVRKRADAGHERNHRPDRGRAARQRISHPTCVPALPERSPPGTSRRPGSTLAGVIGSGMQARFQLRGLRLVRSFRRILVYARNPASVGALRRRDASRAGRGGDGGE